MDYFRVEIDEQGHIFVNRTEMIRSEGNRPAPATPLPDAYAS